VYKPFISLSSPSFHRQLLDHPVLIPCKKLGSLSNSRGVGFEKVHSTENSEETENWVQLVEMQPVTAEVKI
jgi:hypothetical protein